MNNKKQHFMTDTKKYDTRTQWTQHTLCVNSFFLYMMTYLARTLTYSIEIARVAFIESSNQSVVESFSVAPQTHNNIYNSKQFFCWPDLVSVDVLCTQYKCPLLPKIWAYKIPFEPFSGSNENYVDISNTFQNKRTFVNRIWIVLSFYIVPFYES